MDQEPFTPFESEQAAPVPEVQAPPKQDLAYLAREGLMSLVDLLSYVEQLRTQGHIQAACNLYALWLEGSTDPRRHMVYFNYGALLQSQGMTEQAVLAYQACLALDAQFVQAGINLGLSFERLGQHDQALQAWSQVVGQRFMANSPTVEFQTLALNHIGRLHEEHRRYLQAEQVLEESLRLNPKQPSVIQHWVHIRQKACQWPVYKSLPGVSLGEMLRYTSPLAMLALSDDPVQQALTAHSFVARTYSLKEERLCEGRTYQHTKLRIGYVSADLREHAVGFLLPAFFKGHDLDRYELYAYDYTKEESTEVRQQLKSFFHQIRPIHALSDREVAQLILEDEIDILIDLHGLSSGARPGIFALHPAPRQGTYLGFIGSTSMPWFDFVLADRHVLPPELATHFIEKPLYLDGTFLPQAATPNPLPSVARADVGLSDDAFVMAAFGNVYKITPEMFTTWLKLLQRIPKAVVWLIDDNPDTTANLRAQALKAQVDPDRLIFAARTDHLHFCARLRLADVYLDTYPYNCGSTSRDVINAGIPLVSLYGDTMVSRMGLSILHSVHCAELAVNTFADYEDKVVEVFLKHKGGHPPTYSKPSELAPIHTALAQLDEPAPVASSRGAEQASMRKKRRSASDLRALPGAFSAGSDARALLRLYQLEQTPRPRPPFLSMPPAQDGLPGWGALGAVREFLLGHSLDEHAFYGFLPADFESTTGLCADELKAFARKNTGCDVLSLSPHWDLNCLFLNPFVQEEYFAPGFLGAAQQFCSAMGLSLDVSRQAMHSDNTVLGHCFVAKRRFWLRWMELHDQLLSWADSQTEEVSHKILLQDQLVNLLLVQGGWIVKAFAPFALKPSDTFLHRFKEQAVMANALKHLYGATRDGAYLDQFERLQQSLFVQNQLPCAEL